MCYDIPSKAMSYIFFKTTFWMGVLKVSNKGRSIEQTE